MYFGGRTFIIMSFVFLWLPSFFFPLSLENIGVVLTAPKFLLRMFLLISRFSPCPTGGENLLAPGYWTSGNEISEFRTHLCESIDGKQRVKKIGRIGLSFHDSQVKSSLYGLQARYERIISWNPIKQSPSISSSPNPQAGRASWLDSRNSLPMTDGGIHSNLCLTSTFVLIPMRDTIWIYISFVTSSNIYTTLLYYDKYRLSRPRYCKRIGVNAWAREELGSLRISMIYRAGETSRREVSLFFSQ